MLGRHLEKESWPRILPEVSFYCNNMENSSTGFSAQLLMTGRQPLSPVDAMLGGSCAGGLKSPLLHVEDLERTKQKLQNLARQNDEVSKLRMREKYNMSAKTSSIGPGDFVFERNEVRADSLDPRFNGPFRVLSREGAKLRIQRSRGPKWVHANRCKLYGGSGSDVSVKAKSALPPHRNAEDERETERDGSEHIPEEVVEVGEESRGDERTGNAESEAPLNESLDETTKSTTDIPQSTTEVVQRRYPLRTRKPKSFQDYIT